MVHDARTPATVERPALVLRAATAADQPEIVALVRQAGINPLGLHWPNFLLVEELDVQGTTGRVVAIGQVKPHRDGSRELASIAVVPEMRRAGLAALVIHELMRREPGPLYLFCADSLPAFYRRFGFVDIPVYEMPRSLRPTLRALSMLAAIANTVSANPRRLHCMLWEPPG